MLITLKASVVTHKRCLDTQVSVYLRLKNTKEEEESGRRWVFPLKWIVSLQTLVPKTRITISNQYTSM